MTAEADTKTHGGQKQRKGLVVSRSGNKSIVVKVERRKKHPLYGKVVRQSRKFHVHDEKNEAKVGDWVKIAECRPVSKKKHWRLREVLAGRAG